MTLGRFSEADFFDSQNRALNLRGVGTGPVCSNCVVCVRWRGKRALSTRSHALHPGSDAVSCKMRNFLSLSANVIIDAWHLNTVS